MVAADFPLVVAGSISLDTVHNILTLYINADPFLQFKEVWLAIEGKLVHKSYRMIIYAEYIGENPFAIDSVTRQSNPLKVWRSILDSDSFAHVVASPVSIF